MKIAQVSPLYEAVPPKLYGGTERIVSYLADTMVDMGHDVTLFASGDSITKAKLVAGTDEALRLKKDCIDPLAPHIVQMQQVMQRAHEFDVIHFHTDYLHFPFSQFLKIPHVTTLHGRLDIPELQQVYNTFSNPVISISNDQRRPLPQANYQATIYHGLPANLHRKGNGDGNYVAFLGRISPEKGIEKAIEWAKAANIKLKVAAKVDKADLEYFEANVKHLMDDPIVEYIGEVNETNKSEFLGNALALLFPINWCEPFGLVMIEAMACGTPVIAHCKGSVPEVLTDGLNGFFVNTTKQAVEVLNNIRNVDRNAIRKSFDDRFTSERMCSDYVKVFNKLRRQNKLKVDHIDLSKAVAAKQIRTKKQTLYDNGKHLKAG